MRIAFFTENYYKGGLDTFIISLINHWPEKKDEFVLICNKSHPGIERYTEEININTQILWHSLPLLKDIRRKIFDLFGRFPLAAKTIYHTIKLFQYCIFTYNIFAIKKMLQSFNIDKLMIINGGYPGGMSCRAAAISWGQAIKNNKCIMNFHNIAVPSSSRINFDYLIDKIVMKYTSRLTSVSKIAAQSIRTRVAFTECKSFGYIYNGIYMNTTKPIIYKNIRQEFGFKKGAQICLMLGTFEPRKGHCFVLKAFSLVVSRVPNAHLLICGDGNQIQYQNIVKCTEVMGLQQNVTIAQYRRDIDELYANAEVLVIGSQEFESFGLTAIEAMSRKIPVVSTDVGGLKEVVINGAGGFVFDKNDVKGYANKVVALLRDKKLRNEIGKKGRERFEKMFTVQRMANEYYQLITE